MYSVYRIWEGAAVCLFVCLCPPHPPAFPTYPPQAMTGASRVMSAHFHHSLPLSVLPSASQDSSGTASTGREGQVSGEGPGIHATVKQKLKSSLEEQRRRTQLPGPQLTLWLPRPFLLTRVDKVRGEEVAALSQTTSKGYHGNPQLPITEPLGRNAACYWTTTCGGEPAGAHAGF